MRKRPTEWLVDMRGSGQVESVSPQVMTDVKRGSISEKALSWTLRISSNPSCASTLEYCSIPIATKFQRKHGGQQ